MKKSNMNPFPTDVSFGVSFLKNYKIVSLHPNFTIPSTSHSPSSSLETMHQFVPVDLNSIKLKSSFDVYQYNITPISNQLLFFS